MKNTERNLEGTDPAHEFVTEYLLRDMTRRDQKLCFKSQCLIVLISPFMLSTPWSFDVSPETTRQRD